MVLALLSIAELATLALLIWFGRGIDDDEL